jgi:hypothetical protein
MREATMGCGVGFAANLRYPAQTAWTPGFTACRFFFSSPFGGNSAGRRDSREMKGLNGF